MIRITINDRSIQIYREYCWEYWIKDKLLIMNIFLHESWHTLCRGRWDIFAVEKKWSDPTEAELDKVSSFSTSYGNKTIDMASVQDESYLDKRAGLIAQCSALLQTWLVLFQFRTEGMIGALGVIVVMTFRLGQNAFDRTILLDKRSILLRCMGKSCQIYELLL